MPLYEYRCESCGEKEEKLEGFDAPTEHDCPQCGEPLGMHRQVSLTSFTLAGRGLARPGLRQRSSGKKAGSSPPRPNARSGPSGRLRRGLRLPCGQAGQMRPAIPGGQFPAFC